MQEVKGNLIDMALAGQFDVIAHGCNCMSLGRKGNSGLYPQMAETFNVDTFRYPLESQFYRGDINKLGQIQWNYYRQFETNGLTVVNCYTQYLAGPNLDYHALILCFKKLNHKFRGRHVGLPWIGCGIAGGDIMDVRKLIKQYLADVKVTLVEYDNA